MKIKHKNSVLNLFLVFILSFQINSAMAEENKFFQISNPDIKRGEYLTDILLCSNCHSSASLENGLEPFNSKTRLAGGIPIEAPSGRLVYIKNITSDVETGIGNWNFEQLQRAITEGINREGERLAFMDYRSFRNMTNADLNAIIAYLKTTKPIRHNVPSNKPAPSSERPVGTPTVDFIYGDPLDYGYPDNNNISPKTIDKEKDNTQKYKLNKIALNQQQKIKQGEYLVTTAGCKGCHTPSDKNGPINKYHLAGGMKIVDPICGTIFSSNLTNDVESGLGNWTENEIITALKQGVSKDGRVLCHTVMPWINLVKLTDNDAMSIASYLKSLAPVYHKLPKTLPPTDDVIPRQKFFNGDAGKGKSAL